ncbi:MAG TPA: M20/M25/M40 family metallo-hydrolase, partial [Paracoccaceae bacterium]|nr:M20/M25/M40 family metallo-hydrolase [Paracoccaceae bacterium]
PAVQEMAIRRMQAIVDGQAAAYGVAAILDYQKGYPATINHAEEAAFAAGVAAEIIGKAAVNADAGPEMGAEDFSYMLEKRRGAYLFIGNGDSAGLHHPAYDFADEAAPVGASFFARLVERAQPAG